MGGLTRYFPWRRSRKGTEPGIKNKQLNSKNSDDVEEIWEWPARVPTEPEKNEMLARMGEIGLRTIFENFMYTFGGQNFLQLSGGPIETRVTMVAARIVIQDWSEQYSRILIIAKLEILWICR